jgi:hypothetical protein
MFCRESARIGYEFRETQSHRLAAINSVKRPKSCGNYRKTRENDSITKNLRFLPYVNKSCRILTKPSPSRRRAAQFRHRQSEAETGHCSVDLTRRRQQDSPNSACHGAASCRMAHSAGTWAVLGWIKPFGRNISLSHCSQSQIRSTCIEYHLKLLPLASFVAHHHGIVATGHQFGEMVRIGLALRYGTGCVADHLDAVYADVGSWDGELDHGIVLQWYVFFDRCMQPSIYLRSYMSMIEPAKCISTDSFQRLVSPTSTSDCL